MEKVKLVLPRKFDLVVGDTLLVGMLREVYPDVKVRIMGIIPPSAIGGMGASYGATMPYCDYYGFLRYVLTLNKAYEEWTLEPEYQDFMEYIP